MYDRYLVKSAILVLTPFSHKRVREVRKAAALLQIVAAVRVLPGLGKVENRRDPLPDS